jgi:hypothetical protein
MEAMKSYFDYIAIRISCGIPEITLKGTTEDWRKILDKTIRKIRFKMVDKGIRKDFRRIY